jgi:para-nitrobenzyl esterase
MQNAPGQGKGKAPAGPAPSEDCLYLNIWTPAKSAGDRLPVIVWSYGGGFNNGAGSNALYEGEALSRKGAVVVTYNYRLGVFGFFAHPELTKESGHNASGNYALMDLAAALRWVKKNISAFGGDPTRVTIDGESAGGMLVGAMVASPEGKGLFHRAISQSAGYMGLGLGRARTRAQAEEAGVKAAEAAGAKSLSELRAMSAQDVFQKIRVQGGVIVDGWMIPEDPREIFAKGKQNDVDVLVGSNQDEGTFFARGPVKADDFKTQARQRFADLTDSYLKLYPAGTDAEAGTSELARVRDELAWHMRIWAQLQSQRGKKAYWYYFTRVPPVAPGQPNRGATHTAELAYMFNNLAPGRPWEETDRKLADMMATYWVNFAAKGDPNGNGLPNWPAFKEKTSARPMVLGDNVGVEQGVAPPTLAFFDQAYAKQ